MAHILIVDDSPTEVRKISKILEKYNHEISVAENGMDGVELAKAKQPDLILMDVVMPGTNGFQATRQITRAPETANIPVIIVTTKDQKTDRVWAERQGAKGYLVKPAGEKELINEINNLLP